MKDPTTFATSCGGRLVPEFLLRCDFPDELCWDDDLPRRYKARFGVDYDTPPRPPARYFGYFGYLMQGKTEASGLVFDGECYVVVPYPGLFVDLCLRVNHAMGLPPEAPCPIVPRRAGKGLGECAPDYFVYHDRPLSRARILPFSLVSTVRRTPWDETPYHRNPHDV